jgi:hypothetical protein
MADIKAPVVFYSWQSDLPSKTNRGLIEAALKKACKELSAEYEEAIRVDSGIEGEAGSPDIAATILRKIEEATVVVADVSIIGIAPVTASDKTRPVPNANVMFELGYAKGKLGPKRVIMVCNKAFGRIEDLPFDIRGRGVLGYEYKADEGDGPKDARNDLAGQLKAAVATALDAANEGATKLDAQTEEQVLHVQTDQFQALRSRLIETVLTDAPVKLVPDGPVMVLHLVPAASLDGAVRVDLHSDPQKKLLTELSPYGANSWSWFHDAESIATAGVAADADKPTWSFTRLFETGAFQVVIAVGSPLNPIFGAATKCLAKVIPALEKIGLYGRSFVSLDVLRAKGATIEKDKFMFPPDNKGRPIAQDALSPPAQVADAPRPEDAPRLLKPMFDKIWRAAGYERCWWYDEQGNLVRG